MTGPLTSGALFGSITFGVGALLCLVWIIGWWLSGDYDRAGAIVGGVIVLVISTIIYVVAMYPFSYDYHHWVRVDGQVGKIGKRFISNGDNGMSQRYVVSINGQPYGIDDTRASLLRTGDTVHLACKKDFEWGVPREANGWACRWRGSSAG